MRVNLPLLFSQSDSRWASEILGFNTNSAYNFKNFACLITDLAMICQYFGFQEDPLTINSKLKKLGAGKGFVAGSGNYIYGAITNLHKEIVEVVTKTPDPLTDPQLNKIKDALDRGMPVMVQLDYDPKDADLDSHFVVIVDYNQGDENDFTIADPLGGRLHSLKDYLGWFRPSARKTIEKFIIYEGPKPEDTGETVAVPADLYPKIIHSATEWAKAVTEYLPEKRPEGTFFEDLQRVVNGYKSDASASKARAESAEKELAITNTEVANLNDKIANKEAECQRALSLKDAEIKALKDSAPNIDKLTAEYKGTIDALETQLRESQKQGGLKDKEIAELKAGLGDSQEGQDTLNAVKKVVEWIKSIWQK